MCTSCDWITFSTAASTSAGKYGAGVMKVGQRQTTSTEARAACASQSGLAVGGPVLDSCQQVGEPRNTHWQQTDRQTDRLAQPDSQTVSQTSRQTVREAAAHCLVGKYARSERAFD